MARVRRHPKNIKCCAFCEYWDDQKGARQMTFVSPCVGYEFDAMAQGKCMKQYCSRTAGNSSCSKYQPSREACKLL